MNMPVTALALYPSMGEARPREGAFAFADHGEIIPNPELRLVLPAAGEARARALLEDGASQVLLGSAALVDSGIIRRLAERYGGERVGVFAPVRRAEASWCLDTESNADFSCLTTTNPLPRWELIAADGSSTGTDAIWWSEQMVMSGASSVLAMAPTDDADLALCAEFVERLGAALWMAPMSEKDDPTAWIALAGVRQIALAQPWLEPERFSRLAAATHEAAA